MRTKPLDYSQAVVILARLLVTYSVWLLRCRAGVILAFAPKHCSLAHAYRLTNGMPKRAREEPCAICGHWHDVSSSESPVLLYRTVVLKEICDFRYDVQYEAGEPCTVCGHTLARTDDSANRNSAFPTEILPGFLYLGSYDNASRSELLKTVGITHILNVSVASLCSNSNNM